jgi:hypothetical protein
LQLGDGRGLVGLGVEPTLQGLVEAFDLAAGGGVVRPRVLLLHAEANQFGFEAVAAAFAARQSGGEDHPVVGERRCGHAMLGDRGAELVQDDRAGDALMRAQPKRVAGVIIEPAGGVRWSV